MNAKKWPTAQSEQAATTCLVHVEVGTQSGQRDHVSNLILKQARDALKDALVACVERYGGKLAAWRDHRGTFVFRADRPDGTDNCCLAAIQMIDELPAAKRAVKLPDELAEGFTIRIVCDIGPDADGSTADVFAEPLRKYGSSVSQGNKVTITERIFRQLHEPVKSRFQSWKRSPELGVDLYANGEPSLHVVPALADLPDEPEQPAEEQPPAAAAKPSAMTSWLPWAIAGAALAVAVVLAVVRFSPTPAAGVAPPAAAAPPQYPELVQTDEWRNWRKQVHEKLSVEKLSESALAEALTKLPARPESAAAALRRDQAIGDVLMGYQRVSDILWDRFGIDKQNFLGTGLSKPSTALANYGAAMVHEYLIKNIFADSKAIWMRTLDPVNDMRLTVSQLFENDPSSIDPKRKELEREIVQRIKDKDTSIPCVIRFARFDSSQNSRRLGLSQRRYVFASNLAEVWNLSIRDAANLSGYISPKGDTVFVWVFVPEHASEVAPATWDQVLNHLPMWLNEND